MFFVGNAEICRPRVDDKSVGVLEIDTSMMICLAYDVARKSSAEGKQVLK